MFEKLIVGFDGTDTGIDGLIPSMGLAKAFGSPVEFRARTASSPARGLHGPVVSDDADLIVLGSRRPGPWTKVAFGGVSENVMRAAPCAVAVAPRGCRNDGGFVPQRVGVGWIPTDEGNHALEVACRIALEVAVAVHARVGKAAEELVERSGAMDLIVLGSRGYGPARTMLLGSVSADVVPESRCPTMILAARSGRETRN